MNLKQLIPTPQAVVTEAITVVAGALLAAVLVSQFPALRKFITRAWTTQ